MNNETCGLRKKYVYDRWDKSQREVYRQRDICHKGQIQAEYGNLNRGCINAWVIENGEYKISDCSESKEYLDVKYKLVKTKNGGGSKKAYCCDRCYNNFDYKFYYFLTKKF